MPPQRFAPKILYRSIRSFNGNKYTTISAAAEPPSITEESLSPGSGPVNHYDLSSFLDYATRHKLDKKSTVFVGTHYEYTVQAAFKRLGMSLKRIGGRDDYGTDIIGTWSVPSAPHPLKILIQCKAYAGKLNPAHARELEGAFVGAPMGWRASNALGLLVSPNPASKGVRDAIGRTRWPMGFVLCSLDGKILQMMWNRRAAEESLLGIECGIRYSIGNVKQREIVLTWKGKSIH